MKRMLSILLALLFLLAGLAIFVAQPLFGVSYQARDRTVSPASLSSHVLALVRADKPRDADHPENLEAAAAYIHHEFTRRSRRGRRPNIYCRCEELPAM